MDTLTSRYEIIRIQRLKKLALAFGFFILVFSFSVKNSYGNDVPPETDQLNHVIINDDTVLPEDLSTVKKSEFFKRLSWFDEEDYECEYLIEYPGVCVIRV